MQVPSRFDSPRDRLLPFDQASEAASLGHCIVSKMQEYKVSVIQPNCMVYLIEVPGCNLHLLQGWVETNIVVAEKSDAGIHRKKGDTPRGETGDVETAERTALASHTEKSIHRLQTRTRHEFAGHSARKI